jgi:hypothetical protein
MRLGAAAENDPTARVESLQLNTNDKRRESKRTLDGTRGGRSEPDFHGSCGHCRNLCLVSKIIRAGSYFNRPFLELDRLM